VRTAVQAASRQVLASTTTLITARTSDLEEALDYLEGSDPHPAAVSSAAPQHRPRGPAARHTSRGEGLRAEVHLPLLGAAAPPSAAGGREFVAHKRLGSARATAGGTHRRGPV